MDPKIIAAAVTGVLAGAGTVWAAIRTTAVQSKIADRQRTQEEAQRRADAKLVLDKYRGPLLAAAWELGHRIDNIRREGMTAYSVSGHPRRPTAILTTAFRLAQYFGWREIMRVETQRLRLESDVDTQAVEALMGSIYWIFASDNDDLGVHTDVAANEAAIVPDESMRHGSWLMLWLEEQRAIGELMRLERQDSTPSARGYASFIQKYDQRTRLRLQHYAEQMLSSVGTHDKIRFESGRLRVLQLLFLGLVLRLDEEGIYPPYRDNWIGRTWEIYRNPASKPTATESDVRKELGELPDPWARRSSAESRR